MKPGLYLDNFGWYIVGHEEEAIVYSNYVGAIIKPKGRPPKAEFVMSGEELNKAFRALYETRQKND